MFKDLSQENLDFSREFIEKNQNKLPKNMKMTLTASQHDKNMILMFSYQPPANPNVRNYANPVFLGLQPAIFKSLTKNTFSHFVELANESNFKLAKFQTETCQE